MERLEAVLPFAVSLALGALVGIERQRSRAPEATDLPGGVRTFPLIGLLGCSAAWLGARIGPTAFVVVAAGFLALVVASHVVTSIRGDAGMTTEVAAALTFVFGALAFHGEALLAAALAVATTGLLSLRKPLHEFVARIAEEDLYAALKLAILSFVVLPLLPDRDYGPKPYDVLNPSKIWLLVIFVAAMGFAGYVGIKVLGPGRGILVAGGLGGLVSSTAVTLSFSGRSRESPELSRTLALGIAISWAVMLARILVEVAAVNAALVPRVAVPVGAAMAAGVLGALILWLHARNAPQPPPVPHRNPFSLTSAFKFGLLFTAILLASKFAQMKFADAGVLAAAALSGTVDVDAMTLSMARLSGTGEVSETVAVRAICLTAASNTVVKAVVAASIGSPALRAVLLPVVAATLGAGGLVLIVAGL